MVILTESSLNKRHREFNCKLAEAVANNVNFDDVKAEGNDSDIDYMFKIDLASKYKNIDYILESLKSGDSLRISRVLKCTWIFDSEYSHIINPQFINDNIFPNLSLKSKKMLLTTISIYVRNEQRVFEFYEFCKSINLLHNAFKFLLFTDEETKAKVLSENPNLLNNTANIRNFIGNSMNLAKKYLRIVCQDKRQEVLHVLRYLYSNKNIGAKFLDLLETYGLPLRAEWYYRPKKFGLRISKDIILKHKDRIYKNPLLYTAYIKDSMMIKYSTVDDAKYYTTALLPNNANDFWSVDYYKKQKYLFNIIPMEERYQFIKKIFNEKYPGAPFEMTIHFYKLKFYHIMVDLELKEEWALRHIASEKEILGRGKDYLWYRFIKFEKAFVEIKKYMINRDTDVRAEIVNVLIKSARNDQELEILFKYYYQRHINDNRYQKEKFLDAVNRRHSIIDFDSECFAALDKIYHNLGVYNVSSKPHCKTDYKIICLVYRIIKNVEIPDTMIKYIDDSISFYKLRRYTDNLAPDNAILVYNYLMNFYIKIIKTFEDKLYDKSAERKIRKYIHLVLDLMDHYHKSKEEIPEIVLKYVYLDWDEFKIRCFFITNSKKLISNDMMRSLKVNYLEIPSLFPALKERIKESRQFKLNNLLRKLRVYFSNDLAIECLNFYKDTLKEPDLIKHSVNILVFGIIQLGDKKYIHDFMTRYAPIDSKVDHINIDRKLLSVQSAICSYAGYARPPVSLSLMLQYLKGDYTQYCRPIFQMYSANLQPELYLSFVNSIVYVPVSIQKHGLLSLFECYPIDELKKIIAQIWTRTKNISIRLLIYKALYNKIIENSGHAIHLFDTLNSFTATVYDDDDYELFNLITCNSLPDVFIGEHLKTVWKTFQRLPRRNIFLEYRKQAIECIERHMYKIAPKSLINEIIDEHIQYIFDHKEDEEMYENLKNSGLIRSKWHLTIKYITFLENKDNVDKKLAWIRYITSKCFERWNEVIDDFNPYRNFFKEFLQLLKSRSYEHGVSSYIHANIILDVILEELIKLPLKEMYQYIWELKLNIITRKTIIKAKQNITNDLRKDFSEEILNLVLDLIEKGIFWIIFIDDIINAINYEILNIVRHLYEASDYLYKAQICIKLTEMKKPETYFLAAKLFEDEKIRIRECQQLKVTLKNCEYEEIKTFVQLKCGDGKKDTTFI